jgi:dihydrolipoamide dehydrogenase
VSTVRVPDIGDFTDVPVIELLVAVGDQVGVEDPLLTLESDKATMDVPAPEAGTVEEILVEVGDTVSEGTPIVRLSGGEGKGAAADEGAEPAAATAEPEPERVPAGSAAAAPDPSAGSGSARLVVIGSGPAGYTAAFRAADLGLEVILVESFEALGGVCLNVGCIPSKALLHAARVIAEAEEAAEFGVAFGKPEIDLRRLSRWKDEVVGKLTGGLAGLAKRRKVTVITGVARFTSPRSIDVGGTSISFDHCIVAVGSRPIRLPGLPEDPRIIDSTGALKLDRLPERLLVVGGGIIGLEMACIYDALGSRVSVVELTDQLMPGCDRDLVRPLQRRVVERYEAIMLDTAVAGIEPRSSGLEVRFEGEDAPGPELYDRVLVAVGRRANGDLLDAAAAGIEVGDDGVIAVDQSRRTNVAHIFAVGDVAGEPMLAHKGMREGVVAAEVAAGEDVVYDPRSVPSVAYTDPEVAWTGLTETEAERNGRPFEQGSFPWQASGRALAVERAEGLTKVLLDPDSRRVIGAGAVGVNAGELIAEAALAIEMGADATDLALTVHPHPTLSETVKLAAEAAEGIATDIYAPKR